MDELTQLERRLQRGALRLDVALGDFSLPTFPEQQISLVRNGPVGHSRSRSAKWGAGAVVVGALTVLASAGSQLAPAAAPKSNTISSVQLRHEIAASPPPMTTSVANVSGSTVATPSKPRGTTKSDVKFGGSADAVSQQTVTGSTSPSPQ
jgi:hypothetical protein